MGNSESFKNNLIKLQSSLYDLALKLTSDLDDAKDLLQDTTLKALKYEDKYVDQANFKGWVCTIMRSIFLNNYRHASIRSTIIDDNYENSQIGSLVTVAQESAEDAISAKEIAQTIATFSEDVRKPFALYIAGYKYSEIAEILNIPQTTIQNRVFVARKKLQSVLKDYR